MVDTAINSSVQQDQSGKAGAVNAVNDDRFAIGKVVLTVNDLDAVSSFYQQSVGLHLLKGDAASVELGAGGKTLLELRRDASARRRSPREAGLFHTAFLLPARSDLGRWIRHAIETQARVVGASDHAVSEALYLSDPEGNGVEIYTDRPILEWRWRDGHVHMPSDQLDIESILATAGNDRWKGFPEGSVVGHVHLQVGAIDAAEAFYNGVLGLDVTSRYPGGTFYAVNGYHHHVATNIWNSRGAGPRSYPSTGLESVVFLAGGRFADPVRAHLGADAGAADFTIADPWGTKITFDAREPGSK
ncbi:VOC family protein [Rhizobium daejeonense]|uniref:VOC family protein n=1 Tax=Rhizobium daejeonense TaxID=240521 RepID=A0A6M1S0S9_9HYPH|nr:VOC family protein [Rhizobium daejeonense]NGO64583.1 VOC family protein [Rhizobium daejeonense]